MTLESIPNSPRLFTGDCLTAPWTSRRNAWICDPPANIGFMRAWDKTAPDKAFTPPLPPRSNAHLREPQSEYAFQRYWGERFGMMYDQSEDDAVAIVWALPRTAHLTQTALRWAGWRILDSWHHVFGQGWNKNGGHLKPAHEVWFIALKGKPALCIDACRVPRGGGLYGSGANAGSGGQNQRNNVTRGGGIGIVAESNPLGSHPPNFAMTHHPDCERIGDRKVKGAVSVNRNRSGYQNTVTHGAMRVETLDCTYSDDGKTETIEAVACAASCPCGRHWLEANGGKPSGCECGRQGEWVCPVAELNYQSGNRPGMSGGGKHRPDAKGGMFGAIDCESTVYADQGNTSRFFANFGYYAKAGGSTDADGVPRGERHAGCEELYWRANKKNLFGFDQVTREEWERLAPRAHEGTKEHEAYRKQPEWKQDQRARGNTHATVKGLEQLMYLIKLSGGDKIGDLCFGSGGTAIACQLLGKDYEGAELCPEAVTITKARLAFWSGLTLATLERFKLTGEMPAAVKAAPAQGNLFKAVP
jgi:hypothetical protein